MKDEEKYRKLGYNVVSIWESEWELLCNSEQQKLAA